MNPRLGIDVGSTTVKLAIFDPGARQVLYSSYRRHNAQQTEVCREIVEEAAESFGTMRFRMAVCGSGGRPISEALGSRYVQEVVSNAAAVRSLYPQARTAIELGGQDAKTDMLAKLGVSSARNWVRPSEQEILSGLAGNCHTKPAKLT